VSQVYRVLVFPGGTEIGLEIYNALCQSKDIRLQAASASVSNHAPYVFTMCHYIPSVTEPSWIDALNALIDRENIDFVFPAHDDVLVALAQHAEAIHARIVTSPLATCLIARSKAQTYKHLAGVIPVPHVFEDIEEVENLPVFLKPDKGQGSQGTFLVRSKQGLRRLLDENPESIVTEYLPGDEYTIDCFTDRQRGLLFCAGRQRVRTRAGISMHTVSVSDATFYTYANAISSRLTFHGAWFFQLKKDCRGTYKLLEAAPRIAGTMALRRVQGVNFPLLSIYEQLRVPISILVNDVEASLDRAIINRYQHTLDFGTVYVDLDDTLILREQVNTRLVRLLYQFLNAGKRLVLLTRHKGDLLQTLIRFRLQALFDEVIHVPYDRPKSDFVTDPDAIFIDDSFSERERVVTARHIATFDCSMLELLINDREL
jgi:carbamoyl-phosphate synthase large subunit